MMSILAWKHILAALVLITMFTGIPLLHGLTSLFADEPASRPGTIAEMIEAAKARKNRAPGPVADEIEARFIAFDAYFEKMKLNVLAEEGPRSISTVTLGYDLEGFGKRGDRVWQVLISTSPAVSNWSPMKWLNWRYCVFRSFSTGRFIHAGEGSEGYDHRTAAGCVGGTESFSQ